MKPDKGQVSLWASFDEMIGEAEEQFFELNFQKALQIWSDYANITGTVAWQQNYRQLQSLIGDFQKIDYSNPDNIFKSWLQIRGLLKEKKISYYSFGLLQKLYATTFLQTKLTVSFDLATGVFCFIDGRLDNAVENLTSTINQKPDSLLARIFISKCYYLKGQEEKGLGYLTQAMFLGGNELIEEDIEPQQIRTLYNRLKALHGKGDAGIWLAPFEAWHRNNILIMEDLPFFHIMQQKERSERILQVKFYISEKYRHFIRCLYLAEYVREYLHKEKGIIWEQEAYMEKLDGILFDRYRKKRKPIE
jgi:hypothetical protein